MRSQGWARFHNPLLSSFRFTSNSSINLSSSARFFRYVSLLPVARDLPIKQRALRAIKTQNVAAPHFGSCSTHDPSQCISTGITFLSEEGTLSTHPCCVKQRCSKRQILEQQRLLQACSRVAQKLPYKTRCPTGMQWQAQQPFCRFKAPGKGSEFDLCPEGRSKACQV